MGNKTLGFKIPEEWIPHIDRIAKEQGLEKSEACRIAIAAYFGLEYNNSELPKAEVEPGTLTALTNALTKLTARVTAIEEDIKPAKNVIKFPTGSKRSPQLPVTSKQSPVKQPTTNPRLKAIANRAEQCGMSLEEAIAFFHPWLKSQ